MGSDNSHLRLVVASDAYEFTAIRWQKGDAGLKSGDSLDIAFHPQINEFNGNVSVQLIIDDIHSDSIVDEEIPSQNQYKIFDNRKKVWNLQNINDEIKKASSNIKVFIESKYIYDTVKKYPELASRVCSRYEITKCDVLMFFDYPADKKTLDIILEKAQPKKVHFMSYEPKVMDEAEFLKTFTGMVKFAAHNMGGKIDLVRCAGFLGKSIEVFQRLLDLYEEVGFLTVTDRNNAFYIIDFKGIDDLSKVLHSTKYAEIFDMIVECEAFQRSLLEDDLAEVLL